MLDVVSLDAPVCLSIHKLHYGVAKFEEAKIECEVDADPADVKFEWEFNNTAAEKLDIFSFTSEGQRSVATYTPKVEMDYGVLYCWAINSVGKMTEPCVFFVIQAGTQIIIVHLVMIMPLASSFQCPVSSITGPPDPPDNCSIANITAHSLTVQCLPGYSGGLDQTFFLEVHSDSNHKRLITKLTSKEYPFFVVHNLPAGNTFELLLYSANSKGKSRLSSINGSTLLAAQYQAGLNEYFQLKHAFLNSVA